MASSNWSAPLADDLGPTGAAAAPLVLIVEDNRDNLSLMMDYLSNKGFAVRAAHNGYQALELIPLLRPAAVLMDIQMPGIDGLEVTRRLRAMPDLARLPIIAVTALAMSGDRERCLAAGASAYVSKPVSFASWPSC